MFFALTTGVLLTLGAFWTYHELTSPANKPILSVDLLQKIGIQLPDYLTNLLKYETKIVQEVAHIYPPDAKTNVEIEINKEVDHLAGGKRVHPGLLGQANLKDLLDKKGLHAVNPKGMGPFQNFDKSALQAMASTLDPFPRPIMSGSDSDPDK